MTKRGKVFFRDALAGHIEQRDGEYIFSYDSNYLNSPEAVAVSVTLPLREEEFRQTTLFSFFDGLIPEGWLLDLAEKKLRLDRRDRMELLLTVCRECIGAVSIVRDESNER